MARKSNVPERIESGTFSSIPHIVLDSLAFIGATDKARSLLFAIIRQINGSNNGHLQLTSKWLKQQGYTCPANNKKACDELLERGLIVQTKWGGLNMGANLYAVTWLPISNPVGLDISPSAFARGEYLRCDLPPTKRREVKKNARYTHCNSPITTSVIDGKFTATTTVTKNALSDESPVTVIENNVSIPYTVRKNRQAAVKKRIVGVKGMSGTNQMRSEGNSGSITPKRWVLD